MYAHRCTHGGPPRPHLIVQCMVIRLMTSDVPSLAGNWFRALCAPSTTALIMSLGILRKGKPCTVHLTRSLTVLMDRSTSATWSSAAATFTAIGSRSLVMHLNSWSASILEMLNPRASYKFVTARASISKVLLCLLFIAATVRNLTHSNMV
jgi:hypothetical protein